MFVLYLFQLVSCKKKRLQNFSFFTFCPWFWVLVVNHVLGILDVIHWVVSLPSNSHHHQDYYIFSRKSLYTFICHWNPGRGNNPWYTQLLIRFSNVSHVSLLDFPCWFRFAQECFPILGRVHSSGTRNSCGHEVHHRQYDFQRMHKVWQLISVYYLGLFRF